VPEKYRYSTRYSTNEEVFFAGQSAGFNTKYQQHLSGDNSWGNSYDNYDAFVYKFDFNNPNDSNKCLY
jgi:hypothetical protein